jgi:hypothetical protein
MQPPRHSHTAKLHFISVGSATVCLLESRSQYTCCHIQTADSAQRLAAICVDEAYYSFFRATAEQQTALKLAARLQQRGDRVVLTKLPKGYGVWVLEPDAQGCSGHTVAASPASDSVEISVLVAPSQYQRCWVRVPDLDKPLIAVLYSGKFYSLFKAIADFKQVLPVIRRLSQQGDDVIVTQTPAGYALWILEPDAHLV